MAKTQSIAIYPKEYKEIKELVANGFATTNAEAVEKIADIHREIPAYFNSEVHMLLPVFIADAGKISSLAGEKGVDQDKVVNDLLKIENEKSYVLVLEGEEHVKAIGEAFNRYIEVNKLTMPVDESQFLATLAAAYIKENPPKNPEGKDIIKKA